MPGPVPEDATDVNYTIAQQRKKMVQPAATMQDLYSASRTPLAYVFYFILIYFMYYFLVVNVSHIVLR